MRPGIPVFTADIACLDAEAKIVSHIATDNQEGGRQAGHAMLERLGQTGGKVVILDYRDAESCLLRVQGFKEVIDHTTAHNRRLRSDIVFGTARQWRSRARTKMCPRCAAGSPRFGRYLCHQ